MATGESLEVEKAGEPALDGAHRLLPGQVRQNLNIDVLVHA